MGTPMESSQPPPNKAGPAAARSFGRAANWSVGAAAALLVLTSVGGYFYHREQLSAIAAEHLRLIVTGPSSLQTGVDAEYLVSTTTIGGQPLAAKIEAALSDPDGKLLKGYQEPADDSGLLRIVIPADLQLPPRTKLKVVARHGESQEEMEAPLRVTPAHKVAIGAGMGVSAANKPVEVKLSEVKAGLPLVVAAYCRGVQVGQQPLVTKPDSAGGNRVEVRLDSAATGVIRLAVFDYSAAPPKLVAERLVYRRPAQKLNIRIEGLRKQYAPGENVDLKLSATDESGKPAPAAFGVSASDGPPDADFHISDETKDSVPAVVELDLRLGTPGRPRLAEKPPLMFDNLGQIRSNYEKNLTDYHAGRTEALNTLTTASFFGGLGLVVMVAMLGLMRIVSGMHLWIAAIGAATCCLIIGAILVDPGRPESAQDATIGFASYSAQSDAGEPAPDVNRDSVGTLLWEPLLTTDPAGKASVSFKTPNAPGVFHLNVEAHGDGRLGFARAEIVVRAPDKAPPP
jgi:hypothetical protein